MSHIPQKDEREVLRLALKEGIKVLNDIENDRLSMRAGINNPMVQKRLMEIAEE